MVDSQGALQVIKVTTIFFVFMLTLGAPFGALANSSLAGNFTQKNAPEQELKCVENPDGTLMCDKLGHVTQQQLYEMALKNRGQSPNPPSTNNPDLPSYNHIPGGGLEYKCARNQDGSLVCDTLGQMSLRQLYLSGFRVVGTHIDKASNRAFFVVSNR